MAGHGLLPLLISAGILLGANGLIGTLIAVRASLEGFPEAAIGLMGTAYFAGFFGGSLLTPKLIARAGHVRVFAALAALSAIAALGFVLALNIPAWIAFRVLTGFAFSGLSMVVESWLNERAASADRGRVLSLYRIVDLGAVTGSQFLLPVFGPGGFEIFAVAAILFAAALIPISLSKATSPPPPAITRLQPLWVWRLSPVAAAGCITLGLTNGAFRTVGPLYAGSMGLSVDQVALFMSLGIAGGALLQYPFGWLSDRTDRRFILLLATAGAAASSLYLASTESSVNAVLLGGFLFGSFALPLYSLSAAHANDHAKPGEFIGLAAGLTLFYALGASIGPLASSLIIERFGAPSFFNYTCSLHGLFILFVLYRMTKRAAVPAALRSRFVALLRTSPLIFRLSEAPKDGDTAAKARN
ncbi:MAG: MFS transporter [Pseudomonadota bacterium]